MLCETWKTTFKIDAFSMPLLKLFTNIKPTNNNTTDLPDDLQIFHYQTDALNFIMSLFHASTCFEHHVLIVRRPKFYYTASGIITLIGVMIPEAV